MGFGKHLVRYGVITGLVGGTACLVAGPDRLSALFETAQEKINTTIDAQIEDPIALRHQMRSLEGEYPKRIAEVRGDLAELRQQVAQLEREREVSERVVSLAVADMDQMRGLVDRAETTQASLPLDGSTQILRVVFNNESIDLKEAYQRAGKIQQVHTAYSNRCADIERDLGYLAQQEQRLAQMSEQLETEHAEFQSQMWSLDRQVDQISRNDRLISLMEKRQRTLDEQSRYKAGSLEHLTGRFADIRARQEAKLEALGTSTTTNNYENRAKFDLDARKAWGGSQTGLRPFNTLQPLNAQPSRPGVIEIRPDDLPDSVERDATQSPAAQSNTPAAKGPALAPSAQLKPVAPIKPIAMSGR